MLGIIYSEAVGGGVVSLLAQSCGYAVEKNWSIAAAWFQQAAEQGHVQAQFMLSQCYRFGLGVVQNDAEADRWERLADLSEEEATPSDIDGVLTQAWEHNGKW